MNHGEIVSFIWGVADLIRDTFKRGKYQDVILLLTVLRRLDCVLLNPDVMAEDTDPDYVISYVDITGVDPNGRISVLEDLRFEAAPSRAFTDADLAKFFLDWLFERFRSKLLGAGEPSGAS